MVDAASSQFVYELKVGMTCEGCSGAVTRILQKSDQITKVECDVAAQKVLVEGADGLDIAAMLQKWVITWYNLIQLRIFLNNFSTAQKQSLLAKTHS